MVINCLKKGSKNVGQSRSPRYCSKSQNYRWLGIERWLFWTSLFKGPQIPDELLTDDVNVTNADDEESDNDIEDDQTSSESGSDEDFA